MANNTDIQFQIKSIQEDLFWIKKIPIKFHTELSSDLIKYEINLTIALNEKDSIIVTKANITGSYDDEFFLREKVWSDLVTEKKEDLIKLLYLEYQVSFFLSPITECLEDKKGEKQLTPSIFALITDMTLSMARGHIFAKTEGSIFAQNPLPYFTPKM